MSIWIIVAVPFPETRSFAHCPDLIASILFFPHRAFPKWNRYMFVAQLK